MADGQVVFEITGDDKNITASIKEVTENIKKESKKWDDAAEESTGNIVDFFKGMAKGILGTLSAAAIANEIRKWSIAAIDAASDLSEVQNVVDVTFGESSGRIDAWSKQAGKAYGLTEKQAKQYTSTIGAMLKSQGMADDEIVKTSTDLAGLAADMASFYNLDFDTAFQKIRSGISGETEPLKQLGINMSAANLEAFRLAQGIEKSYAAMSQSEQTALRYQYIMQATADAQGDFTRTADGYANASRRMETAMETIKTKGGQLLMTVVEPLTVSLAELLETLTAAPDTTVLDDIAAIETKTGEKISRIQQTADDARILADELVSLGDKEKLTGDQQAYWLETTNRLLKTLPGLSAIINGQTGELNGGTQAIYDYIKAWEEGQTKLAMMGALQQKENAISERFADLPGLQLDMALAQRRVREQKKKLDQLRKELGIDANGYSLVIRTNAVGGAGVLTEAEKQWNAEVEALGRLNAEATRTEDAYKKQKDALDEAQKALEEYRETIKEMPGDTEAAAAAADKLTEAQKAAAEASVEAVKTAISALADYVQSVHDATEQAVNSVVKGFDVIERPTTEMEEKRSKLIEQQNALNRSTAEGERQYQALQKQIDSLNESMSGYTAKGMEDALKSQLAFMDEYVKNLEQAQKMGLSDDLLASLSDGSVQSAEYLAQLVANPEQAKEIDALYQQVQQKKKGFTDALTDQKLAADDMYASLVDTAKDAIAQMDQGEDAKTAMENTVAGLASGISEKVPEVRSVVNDLLAELNRLSGFGVNITIPGFGSLLGPESSISFHGASAAPTGMNYDLLGDVVRSNTGGNVYLDGRKVGSLISEQQGNSFRSMQRSGFQQ